MNKIKLLLFDVDGTLVDSRADIINSINHMLISLGKPEKSDEEIISYVGPGREYLLRCVLGEITDNEYREAFDIFTAYQRTQGLASIRLYPGVCEALEHFSSLKKVIVSNRQIESVMEVVDFLHIAPCFEAIAGDDGSQCIKPSGCPVKAMCERFSVCPAEAMMIGDLPIDIASGKAAGSLTCGVTYGLGRRVGLEAAGADYIVDSITELKNIIPSP